MSGKAGLIMNMNMNYKKTYHQCEAIRNKFPVFERCINNHTLHYLDSAAMTQVPNSVLDEMKKFEITSRSNIQRSVYQMAAESTEAYEGARDSVSNYINASSSDEIIFTSGTTNSINLLAQSFGANLNPGDEIVISLAEHHSNFVPWQILRDRYGIVLKAIPLKDDGILDLDELSNIVSARCKLIAVTHVSNVTGAITEVARIVESAKKVGAKVFLDGAQAVPHGQVDVQGLGIDFYAFSGHKSYGPTGIGVLWCKNESLEKLLPTNGGGGMVERVSLNKATFKSGNHAFEAGTPPIVQAIGLGKALDWLQGLRWDAIRLHEKKLSNILFDALKKIPDLRILGEDNALTRMPIFSFVLKDIHPHDFCHILDQHGVAIRGGHHCAQPLLTELNLFACSRVSIGIYNNEDDINAFIRGLHNAIEVLK